MLWTEVDGVRGDETEMKLRADVDVRLESGTKKRPNDVRISVPRRRILDRM